MDDWVEVEGLAKGAGIPLRPASKPRNGSADLAKSFYKLLESRTLERLKECPSGIFRVDLGEEPVYDTFSRHLPLDLTREYNCSACRRFTKRYGDLALVADDGTLRPLYWSVRDLKRQDMVRHFSASIKAVQERFRGKKVIKEFKPSKRLKMLGVETQDGFNHMHVGLPDSRLRKAELPGFTSADTPELAAMLARVLADYDLDTVRQVNLILLNNKVPHADNHKASSQWLLDLMEKDKMAKAKDDVGRHNLLYRYAASSFIGSLKQMRSGALSLLLENVWSGAPWQEILSEWNKIVDPLQYMRPQAAPSEGNIKSAERLFTQLGLTENDLRRRLCVQDDVPQVAIMWASERMGTNKSSRSSSGVFGSVKAKPAPALTVNKASPMVSQLSKAPATTMSFSKFVSKVLPQAKQVECWVTANANIVTLISGFDDSKPMLQWDHDEHRNAVSWYVRPDRPRVDNYHLKPDDWNEVRCLIPYPHLWDGAPVTTTFPLADPDLEGDKHKYYHKSKGFQYLFVLDDHHETRLKHTCIFPELQKSEFHGIRSTLEAYSRTHDTLDVADGAARGGFVGGIRLARDKTDDAVYFRVLSRKGGTKKEEYKVTLFE